MKFLQQVPWIYFLSPTTLVHYFREISFRRVKGVVQLFQSASNRRHAFDARLPTGRQSQGFKAVERARGDDWLQRSYPEERTSLLHGRWNRRCRRGGGTGTGKCTRRRRTHAASFGCHRRWYAISGCFIGKRRRRECQGSGGTQCSSLGHWYFHDH